MKKIILLLISVLLFIPVVVNAAECDISKVYIDSIGIENSKGKVLELEEGTAKDKKINLNLKMYNKDDEILYRIVLKNDSEDDYEINKNNINLSSDYIDYSLESDDNNIVKAKSSKTIYLRVKYSKEVDQSKFVNGVYQDDITMKVNLSYDDIQNPNTGINYIIIVSLIILLSGILLIIFINKKYSKLMIIVIALLIIIPYSVNALCSCEIELNSKVTITNIKQYKVRFLSCHSERVRDFEYEDGMTWREYFNSPFYTTIGEEDYPYLKLYDFENNKVRFFITQECSLNPECRNEINIDEEINLDSKIIPLDKIVYIKGDNLC